MTDVSLRRSARALGYKGKYLSMAVADVLVHPLRPGESTLLQNDGETRRAAANRLRDWLWRECGHCGAMRPADQGSCECFDNGCE